MFFDVSGHCASTAEKACSMQDNEVWNNCVQAKAKFDDFINGSVWPLLITSYELARKYSAKIAEAKCGLLVRLFLDIYLCDSLWILATSMRKCELSFPTCCLVLCQYQRG
jgi:hypothetical protein